MVRLAWEDGDPPEISRDGHIVRLPLGLDDFKTVFSIRAQTVSHSGTMELQAVKSALLRLTRSARLHAHRGAVLVDARAVGFSLQKGRSSSGTLARGVAAVGAISLASDLKLSYPYLPSESMPADWPSRGKVRKNIKRKRDRKPAARAFAEMLQRAYRQAYRRWRTCARTSV